VPAKEVNLAFEQGGRVQTINFEVGDHVNSGSAIARLDAGTVSAQLSQSRAMVQVEEAKLAELKKGTRAETLQIYETRVASAAASLDSANKNVIETLRDAYTKADDAVYSKTDEIFNSPRSTNPKVKFLLSNASLRITIENGRLELSSILPSWESSVSKLGTSENISSEITKSKNNLETTRTFLNNVASAVNGLIEDGSLSAATISSYKTNVGAARTSVNAAIAAVQAAEASYSAAQSALTVAQNELALQKAGASAEAISAEEAALASARANVALYEAQVGKTTLVSPISGVITKLEIKRGEIASPNAPVVTIISDSALEVESYVPESDMTKIQKGDSADVRLDAYGNFVIFAAKVISIDPAETMKEGVPTYKTTFAFTEKDARVKSGMTADVRVFGGKKENVLAIPGRAIETKEGKSIAKILKNEIVTEVEVSVGMKGANGMVEIISGIAEGDEVITYTTQ
jgi:RND family efflux transporter MFP subunit